MGRLGIFFCFVLTSFCVLSVIYKSTPSTEESSKPNNVIPKKQFHTIITSDTAIYGQWMSRVMYYWFLKNRGPDMGGFTRILQSGKPDAYMNEIPTFVAKPLAKELEQGYAPMQRPWAVVQWLEEVDIEEDYIFMGDPDHLILRPIQNMATSSYGAAFPFSYITPRLKEACLKNYVPGGQFSKLRIDPIGNSPGIVSKEALLKIAPLWANLTILFKRDTNCENSMGWVMEMYSYALASALTGYKHKLIPRFLIHPPYDKKIGHAFILHYTYRLDYDLKGNPVTGRIGEWNFDKRSYIRESPKNVILPPKGVPEASVMVVQMIVEATKNIKGWI